MLIIASCLPLRLLLYQILIDHVNLFPWNDVSKRTTKTRVLEFLINYLPLLISFAFFHPSYTSLLWGTIGSVLYLAGHIRAWWIPYFFGATENEQAEYNRYFSRTYKFLPARNGHPVPDAEHVVLGCINLAMTVVSVIVFFSYPMCTIISH